MKLTGYKTAEEVLEAWDEMRREWYNNHMCAFFERPCRSECMAFEFPSSQGQKIRIAAIDIYEHNNNREEWVLRLPACIRLKNGTIR